MEVDLKIVDDKGNHLDSSTMKYPDIALATAYLMDLYFRKIQEDFPTARTVFITIKGESNDKGTRRSLNSPPKVLTRGPNLKEG